MKFLGRNMKFQTKVGGLNLKQSDIYVCNILLEALQATLLHCPSSIRLNKKTAWSNDYIKTLLPSLRLTVIYTVLKNAFI